MAMVSPCNFIVVCVSYYLLGRFIIMCVCVACMLIGLIIQMSRTWVRTICTFVMQVLAVCMFIKCTLGVHMFITCVLDIRTFVTCVHSLRAP